MGFKVPAGSLVVPTDNFTASILMSKYSKFAHEDRVLRARLKSQKTTIVAPELAHEALEHAKAENAPVVFCGDDHFEHDTTPDLCLKGAQASDLVFLEVDDVSQANNIIVVGDLHNCHRTLLDFLKEINSGQRQTETSPLVVLVGDIIDKGGKGPEDSLKSLELVMDLTKKGVVASARGNHEQMLLRRLNGQSETTPTAKP